MVVAVTKNRRVSRFSGDDFSLLDSASTPAPTDEFSVRQSGDTEDKKMTRAQVHALGAGINIQNSNYTTVLADAGKTIYKASGGPPRTFTIDSNANVPYPIGTRIYFSLAPLKNVSIAVTDDTLIWADDNTVGTRKMEEGSYSVAQKLDATTWIITSSMPKRVFTKPLPEDMPSRLVADVGSSQGDGVIVQPYNFYYIVGTDGDAATLPATFDIGTRVYIKNDDASQYMDIFPAAGNDLGEGDDTPLKVPAGTSVTFIGTVKNTDWRQLVVLSGYVGILDASLTAEPGGVQGENPLTSDFNIFTTVASFGDSATLPAVFKFGQQVTVTNSSDTGMNIFPASGDQISGHAADGPDAIAAGDFVTYVGTEASSKWTKLMGGTAQQQG